MHMVIEAISEVLQNRRYLGLAAVASIVMAFMYIFIPVFYTPGNTFEFWLEITPPWYLAFLVILSVSMGTLIAMQVYTFKRIKVNIVKEAGGGIMAAGSSIVGGLFASASCGACVGALFSFLGAGGVIFLLEHRIEIALMGLGFVAVAMYFTSKKITGKCEDCKI